MGFLQDIGEDSGTLFKSHTALCLGATRRGVRVLLCLRAPPHVSLFKVLKVISSGGANRFNCSEAHLFRRRCRVESFQFFPRRFDEKCIISESVFSDDSTSEGSCSQGVFNNERHSTILHTAVVQLIGFAVSAVIGVIDLLINCGCKAF